MIGSEKAGKLDLHDGIVRANKMQVNDYFGGVEFTVKIMRLFSNFGETVYNRIRKEPYD
jgi:hypothetical protein